MNKTLNLQTVKVNRIRCGAFALGGIIVGLCQTDLPIYLCYLVLVMWEIRNILRNSDKEKIVESLLGIWMYSLIVASNYVVIIVTMLVAVLLYLKGLWRRESERVQTFNLVLWGYLILNFILGSSGIVHLIFLIFYCFTFVMGKKLVLNFNKLHDNSLRVILTYGKEIVIIEAVTMLCRTFRVRNDFDKFVDLDWVYGTFGFMQGVQMFMVMLFIGLIFLLIAMNYKNKMAILYGIVSMVLAVMTGSTALTVITVGVVLVYFLINARIKFSQKILLVFGGMLVVVFFLVISPQWVRNDIMSLLNPEFLLSRVTKLQTYVDVFYNIPKENWLYGLIGVGIGTFNSRTALTCTGLYIPAYSKLFSPNINEMCAKYIVPKYEYCIGDGWANGTANMPFASITAVQAELGLIGLCLFLGWMVRLVYKKGTNTLLIVFVFFAFLFYDNYVEFPRTAVAFWLAYGATLVIEKREKKEIKDGTKTKQY